MPKIIFKPMTLEANIEIVKWCYFDKNDDGLLDINSYTVNMFPELKNIKDNFTENETNKYIAKIVTKYYNDQLDIIKNSIKKYSILWEKYNDSFFKELCSYLELDWPKEHNEVVATIGIIPVSPRNLDDFSFSTHENINEEKLVEICTHECCHFLWFEKWKELFPDYKRQDFEYPSIIWEYSEMVVDPILNSDKISKIFNKKRRYAYNSFYEDASLMEGLFNIYNENISIEEKINKGFKYINKEKMR